MRKGLVLAALVLVLAVLPATPVVAKGGPPWEREENKHVVFVGDIVGEADLVVEEKRSQLWIHGPGQGKSLTLEFSGKFDDFEGSHDGKVRIELNGRATGEATLDYTFMYYDNEEVDARVPKYDLEGFGTYVLVDEGVYEVKLEDAKIYEVVASRSGKKGKGALGLGHEETPAWELSNEYINFDMTVLPIS